MKKACSMKPNLLTGLTLWLGWCAISFAQHIQVAPLNPQFIGYQQKIRSGVIPPLFTKGGHPLGFIPPPIDISYISKGRRVKIVRQPMPAKYDLRTEGKLTPVKDQGEYGTCWAFATYGSLESCTITASGEVWDFSENNLANWVQDNYDGLGWDSGNSSLSTAYLSGWMGPVAEVDDPYPNPEPWTPKPVKKHIQEVLSLPDRTGPLDNDIIKQAIMRYGAVSTAMYYDDYYFNSSTNAYYYDGTEWANHAVCIVGWDDNYPRTNFSLQPLGDGAFIVRNSWGPSWGDGGYFYVSYYDSQIGTSNVIFPAGESVNNYASMYQYDTLGFTSLVGYSYSSTAWFANIFAAIRTESIMAVSFYTPVPNSIYAVYVYTGVTPGQPISGTLKSSKNGEFAIPGYHTVILDSPVVVSSGQRFSVVIYINTPGWDLPVAVETPIGGYSSKARANPGESFVSPDGKQWSDITTYLPNTNVCLKAFATPLPVALKKTVDKEIAKPGGELTYTITYKNNSNYNLKDLTLTDKIPQNTTYVENSATGNPIFDGSKLKWKLDLPVGAQGNVSFKVKIGSSVANGVIISNKASLPDISIESNIVSTTVDSIPPKIETISPLGGNVSPYPPIAVRIKDDHLNDKNLSFKLDNQNITLTYDALNDCYIGFPPSPLSSGSHSLIVSASDLVGNVSQITVNFNVPATYLPSKTIELVSIPFKVKDNKVRNVLTNLEHSALWRGVGYEFSSDPTLIPGGGLWVKFSSTPPNIIFNGKIEKGDKQVSVYLEKGWQIVGLPWPYVIPVSSLKVQVGSNLLPISEATSYIAPLFYRWDSQTTTYKIASSSLQGAERYLYPWFGYWARVKQNCTLVFPVNPWSSKEVRHKDYGDMLWSIGVQALFPDGKDETVYIGLSRREFQAPLPPSPPSSTYSPRFFILKNNQPLLISLEEEKGPTHTWTLCLRDQGAVTLRFTNLSQLPKGVQMILRDGKRRIYIPTTPSVELDIEGEKRIIVEAGRGLLPSLLISGLEVRSTRGGVNIFWNLSGECNVRLMIKGLDGRTIGGINKRGFAGINSFFWDCRDKEGRRLPAGIYIIELMAQDDANQIVKAIRMVNLR